MIPKQLISYLLINCKSSYNNPTQSNSIHASSMRVTRDHRNGLSRFFGNDTATRFHYQQILLPES